MCPLSTYYACRAWFPTIQSVNSSRYMQGYNPMRCMQMKKGQPDPEVLQKVIEGLQEELRKLRKAEGDLRESEERYRRITSAITDYIYTVFLEDGVPVRTVHSPASEAVTGYTPMELESDPYLWFTMVFEEDKDKVRDNIRLVLAGYDPGPIEHRIIRKDGALRWVSNALVIHRSDSGEMFSYDGVLSDITGRKIAEEGLRESEERFRMLHEAAFGGIGIHDKGFILDCNQGLCDMTGYTREELMGMDGVSNLIAPEWRSHVVEKIVSGYSKPYDVEGLHKDGSRYPLEIRGKNMPYQGRMVRVTDFRDITERKLAQEAIRKSEERFKSLIQNSSDIIVILNARGEFVYETPSFSRVSGYEPGFLLGKNPADIIHPDDLDVVLHDLREVYDNVNDELPSEMRLMKSDGSCVHLEAIGKNLLDYPGIEGLVITARDITDRKKSENERIEMERRFQHAQKLESLGILAGGIAHDFNNLLMAILGNIDLAMTDISQVSRSRHFMSQARMAARRAADLTNQMLAYSGKGRFDLKTFDLSELVEEMSRFLKASISKSVTLNLGLDHSMPFISADPAQMQQVIMNLIVNASEAMCERPGVVTITTGVRTCDDAFLNASALKEKPKAGIFAFLKVKDTGCGMDEATRVRIFDPFFSTKFTGRGLGMAAVQGIVGGHKGAIMVESTPGEGTDITVFFPVTSLARAKGKKGDGLGAPDEDEDQLPLPTGTILLVDDEEMVLDLCSAMVERLGFQVLTGSDGNEAIDIYRNNMDDIVCIILDLTMPKMDGLTAFEVLKGIREDVRVIISSGFSEEEVSHRFEGSKPAGFIKKPFTFRGLRRVLAKVLNKS
jgi:two-component system, cell cycle sensor histidine kinase and response regulator CckA